MFLNIKIVIRKNISLCSTQAGTHAGSGQNSTPIWQIYASYTEEPYSLRTSGLRPPGTTCHPTSHLGLANLNLKIFVVSTLTVALLMTSFYIIQFCTF